MTYETITYQEVTVGDRVLLKTKDGIREVEIDLVLHDPGMVTLGWEEDYGSIFTASHYLVRLLPQGSPHSETGSCEDSGTKPD